MILTKIKNHIYYFNSYLDDYPQHKLIFMLFIISFASISLNFINLWLGIASYIFLGLLTLSRHQIICGKLKMDFSVYDIPNIGDIIVFNKGTKLENVKPSSLWRKEIENLLITQMSSILSRTSSTTQIPTTIWSFNKLRLIKLLDNELTPFQKETQLSFKVVKVEKYNKDISINIEDHLGYIINISFLKSKKYWKTQSQLRDYQIKKILS